MKTTITIKSITTQEVEVSLPQFRKVNELSGFDYYAFYSEDRYKNIYFRTYKGKLMAYFAFADISDITKGEAITQSEFIKAYNDVKDTINIWHSFQNVTNDEQGEYYLTEQEQLLNSHE